MSVLIRSAVVVDSLSPWNGRLVDLLIADGKIQRIAEAGAESFAAESVVERSGLRVSVGWVDGMAELTEPGYEWKDDLRSLSASALAGGFTDLILNASGDPVTDAAPVLDSLRAKAARLPARLHFCGALSEGLEGKEMAELGGLREAGAIAFTDGMKPVQNSGLLMRCLSYLQLIDGLAIQLPFEKEIAPHGMANESPNTAGLGLNVIPALAEELMIARCLQLIAYTGGRLHFSPISTAGSVRLIAEAKAKGLKVTAAVAPHYLFYTDEALTDFDSNFKVMPPLRTADDVAALKAGLKNGTIDLIASHHAPQAVEDKEVEFDYAGFGMLGLETAFGVSYTALVSAGVLTLEELIEKWTIAPRRLFRLPEETITENAPANLTLFTDEKWTVERGNLRSRSSNTPFIGQTLQGRVVATISGGQLFRAV